MTNHKTKNTNLEEGQSLFEVIVAIAISALIVVVIVSMATTSIQNSNFSKDKTLAATYAQQTTEWLRGQRDNDVSTFEVDAAVQNWCLPTLAFTKSAVNPLTECTTPIAGTVFDRWVTFNVTSPGGKIVVEADVVVSWKDSQGLHEVTNATSFSDWRQI